MLTESPKLYSFFVTKDFSVAWRVYREWLEVQAIVRRSSEVSLAGCQIDRQNRWEIRVSEAMHDAYVQLALAQ